MEVKVSILIPVYNIEKYLPRCLESCLNQTLKEIEIICVNDGSKDKSLSVLKKYAKKDNRIKIISKPNGGLPSARNVGMDNATGEYIFYLDGDDYIELDACEILYKEAKTHKASVVIFGARIIPESKNNDWFRKTFDTSNSFYPYLETEQFFANSTMFPFLWRDFILRSHIDNNHFRLDEEIIIGEDTAFQFKILPNAKNVLSIPNKLYNYDLSREGSLTNNKKYQDMVNRTIIHLFLIEKLCEDWKHRGLYIDKNAANFLVWALDFLYWNYFSVDTNEKAELAKKIVESLSKCDIDQYYDRLTPNAQNQYNDIKKFLDYESKVKEKKITLLLPINVDVNKEDLVATIKKYKEYKDDIHILGIMAYNDPIKYMDIESLAFKYNYFSLVNEEERFPHLYYDSLKAIRTKYFTFIEMNKDSLYPYKKVIDSLKDDDIYLANGSKDVSFNTFNKALLSNIIIKKDLIINNDILFANYDIFTNNKFKLDIYSNAKKISTIDILYLGEEDNHNYIDNLNIKLLHLDYILALLDKYQKTNNNEYRIIASTICDNDAFVRNIVSTPFGWNNYAIPLVKEIFTKIMLIANTHLLYSAYAEPKLLIEFVRNNHTHVSGIRMRNDK